MRDKILNLFLDIFEFLRPSASVVHDSHPLYQYLIMLDECAQPAEGSLERREPIGGLFHNIEKHLHTIRNPSPFFWGHQAVGELAICKTFWSNSLRPGSELLPEASEFARSRFRNGSIHG